MTTAIATAAAVSSGLEQSLTWSNFQAAHQRLLGRTQVSGESWVDPASSPEKKQQAAGFRGPHVGPAPLKQSRWLSEAVGGSVWLKLECLHEGGSFKLRGATHALLAYRDQHGGSLPTHVFSASSGNHGLGVTIASVRLGLPCTIVLPANTPAHRIKSIESYGAEVKLFGSVWDEANAEAQRLTKEKEGALYVHPYAQSDVILGQGTIAVEIMEQLDNVDYVLASVGGGGLISGISACYRAKGNTTTQFVAVETEGSDWYYQSIQEDRLVCLPDITTIAKSLGSKSTTSEVYELLKKNIAQAVRVSDKETMEALLGFLEHEKLLIEPATACVVATLLQNPKLFAGKSTVLVICGNNSTMSEVTSWRDQFGLNVA